MPTRAQTTTMRSMSTYISSVGAGGVSSRKHTVAHVVVHLLIVIEGMVGDVKRYDMYSGWSSKVIPEKRLPTKKPLRTFSQVLMKASSTPSAFFALAST